MYERAGLRQINAASMQMAGMKTCRSAPRIGNLVCFIGGTCNLASPSTPPTLPVSAAVFFDPASQKGIVL